jgi:hypothetical protein
MNTRSWTDLLLPDGLNTQLDWLRDLVRDGSLLEHVMRSPAARRLLARETYARHGLVAPSHASLTAEQQWLLLNRQDQLALARRLGIAALHDCVRLTVRASAVAALRKELGDEAYRKATTQPGLDVAGLERAPLDAAVQRDRLGDYLVAVGAALLETTLPADEPFYRLRMGFAFSPSCWQARPRGLQVDPQALAARIAEAARP